ncbi:DMT family transporter [Acetobacter sp. TBRC 12305]|uniref:DMT family transporter n=1 Tax=Acetobacter garciniae TaxID=2817435 RepID=A0A939HNY8_9PROT|nr:DMT family transporter [Acetobacter garciniae]MBO1324529.1 DMT family transporter [Acetobacter garciniae]MBX0344218.1 DMT family transporter [Acetobacter garciniae]
MEQEQTASAPHRPVPVIAVCVALLAWSLAYPLVRLVLPYLSPVPLAALRYGIAAVFILAWLASTRPVLPRRADMPRFALCGVIGIAVYNILFNSGEQTISAGATSLLLNISPFLSALIAVVVLGEKLSPLGWLGSAVSFSGVVIIGSGQPGGFSFGAGATYVLAAALCSATFYLLQKPLIARYGALTTTAWNLLLGAIALLPWLPQAVFQLQGHGAWPWFLMLLLGLFPAVVAYAAWAKVVGEIGVAHSAGFLYLLSPTTLVVSFLMVGEIPSLRTVLGGAVVLAGVAMMQLYGRPRPVAITLPQAEP